MNPIYPFTVIHYTPTVSTWQIGQQVQIGPSPGTTAVSYVITSGTLPAGLSLNATTGIISGSPTTVTPASEILITGTLADTTTRQVVIFITISEIPVIAPVSNQASATDLAVLMNQAQEIFIADAAAMIANNNALGKYSAYFDLPDYAPIISLRNYFQSLGYSFVLITQERNSFQYNTPQLGEFYWWPGSPYGFSFVGIENPPYGIFNAPQPILVRPRIWITWQSTPIYPQWPYYPYSQ